jgi:NADPH2:quinone reductase
VMDVTLLAMKGSLSVTRPAMVDYALPRSNLLKMADELFDLVLQGKIKSEPQQVLPLAEAAEAHRLLESRKTIGATILIP